MLPQRALRFPSESLGWEHLTALLGEVVSSVSVDALVGPLTLSGLFPCERASLLLCVEASTVREVAAWADVVAAHHVSAALWCTRDDLLSEPERRALPGVGLTPVFRGPEDTPLIDCSPAELDLELATLPPGRLVAPRANALGLAIDRLTLEALARVGTQAVFVPEFHPPAWLVAGRAAPPVPIIRVHEVSPDDEGAFLLAWVQGERLAMAGSAARRLLGKVWPGRS